MVKKIEDNNINITKLDLKNGDIICVDFKVKVNPIHLIETKKTLKQALEKRGLDKVLILIVDCDCEISKINEEKMNKHGWFKKEK